MLSDSDYQLQPISVDVSLPRPSDVNQSFVTPEPSPLLSSTTSTADKSLSPADNLTRCSVITVPSLLSPSSSLQAVPVYLRDRNELTPDKLSEIRAKDAERKRRWRMKRRMQRVVCTSQGSVEDCPTLAHKEQAEESLQKASPTITNGICDEAKVRTRTRRHSARRSDISPDRLQVLRAKDAERKRRARLRKRAESMSDGNVSSNQTPVARNLFGTTAPLEAAVKESTRFSSDRVQNHTRSLLPDEHEVAVTLLKIAESGRISNSNTDALTSKSSEAGPSEDFPHIVERKVSERTSMCPGAEQSVTSPLSIDVGVPTASCSVSASPQSREKKNSSTNESSIVSPDCDQHSSQLTPRNDVRIKKTPRKALPPQILQVVRAKDCARKRMQRARKKSKPNTSISSASVGTVASTSSGSDAPARLQLATASALLSPLLGQVVPPVCAAVPHQSAASVLHSPPIDIKSSPVSQLMRNFTHLTSALFTATPSSFNPNGTGVSPTTTLSVDTSSLFSPSGNGGSAPASLFSSLSSTEEGRFEMIKFLVEQAREQFSPRSASEEKASAKRRARAARLARMTEEQRMALRESDRERKRKWRLRRKEAVDNAIAQINANTEASEAK